MKTKVFRNVAILLSVSLATMSVGAPRASAMMAPTQMAIVQAAASRSADLKTIQTALENKMVRQRLAQMGLSTDQVNQRLDRLSDQKLHQAALQIEKQSPAADSSDTAITILIVVAVVAVIIWLWDQL